MGSRDERFITSGGCRASTGQGEQSPYVPHYFKHAGPLQDKNRLMGCWVRLQTSKACFGAARCVYSKLVRVYVWVCANSTLLEAQYLTIVASFWCHEMDAVKVPQPGAAGRAPRGRRPGFAACRCSKGSKKQTHAKHTPLKACMHVGKVAVGCVHCSTKQRDLSQWPRDSSRTGIHALLCFPMAPLGSARKISGRRLLVFVHQRSKQNSNVHIQTSHSGRCPVR
jgi:hypothetical protein